MNKISILSLFLALVPCLNIFGIQLSSDPVKKGIAGNFVYYNQNIKTPKGTISCSYNIQDKNINCYAQIQQPNNSYRLRAISNSIFPKLKLKYEEQHGKMPPLVK